LQGAPCYLGVVRDYADPTLPLWAAATAAHEQVFSARPRPPVDDELDLIAQLLSARLPIYGVRASGQETSRISREELVRGTFWAGATRFELGDNIDAVTQLTVRKADFDRVLIELKRQPLQLVKSASATR
jgi:hypothetical protein